MSGARFFDLLEASDVDEKSTKEIIALVNDPDFNIEEAKKALDEYKRNFSEEELQAKIEIWRNKIHDGYMFMGPSGEISSRGGEIRDNLLECLAVLETPEKILRELDSKIKACETYKAILLNEMKKIYGPGLGDPLVERESDKVKKINKLNSDNPVFNDAYQKYKIVNELLEIAQGYEEGTLSKEIIMGNIKKMDQHLEKNKYALCKFPDNALVQFLRDIGGAVAKALISFIESIGKSFSNPSQGDEFVSKVQSFSQQSKMFGKTEMALNKKVGDGEEKRTAPKSGK
jgi:hypothetical protein